MDINKKLLAEELKRHKQLLEYSFYVDEDDDIDVLGQNDDGKGLILQADPETDQEADVNGEPPIGDEANQDAPEDANAEDIDVDVSGADGATDDTEMTGFGDENGGEEIDMDVPPVEAPAEDEVDVDVTQLVQGTEEAKQMAQMNGQKMEELLNQFSQLTGQLSKMDVITKKIEDLEVEIEKRNPTPVEKLEMRSLDSYPYNLKLTDFWAEKDGNYDTGRGLGAINPNEEKEKEYVLTQDDVGSDYSHGTVKKTFDEYEEEDV
jgi:hypothetical protein